MPVFCFQGHQPLQQSTFFLHGPHVLYSPTPCTVFPVCCRKFSLWFCFCEVLHKHLGKWLILGMSLEKKKKNFSSHVQIFRNTERTVGMNTSAGWHYFPPHNILLLYYYVLSQTVYSVKKIKKLNVCFVAQAHNFPVWDFQILSKIFIMHCPSQTTSPCHKSIMETLWCDLQFSLFQNPTACVTCDKINPAALLSREPYK